MAEERNEFLDAVENMGNFVKNSPLAASLLTQDLNSISANTECDDSFQVMVGLKEIGTHPTFIKAYRDFFQRIKAAIEEGTSYQWLETANFISHQAKTLNGPTKCVLDFYRARDLAYVIGLMKEGQLVESPCEPNELLINIAFLIGQQQNIESFTAMFREWEKLAAESAKRTGEPTE